MKVNKRVFKTNVFTLIVILTCILHLTCKNGMSEENEFEYTNVVYSPDMSYITIYLEGGVSVPRALSKPLAMMGCDYFEVNFLDNANILTRAEWMAGKLARISGLTTGISYGNIAPVAGQGSAILFAGKTDKTIMAVGRLTAVDGVAGTTIAAGSKTITFNLNAVVASVSSTPSASSFLTAARTSPYTTVNAANTVVSNDNVFHTVPSKTFPCFELERLRTVRADYEFKLESADRAFSDYGIFVSPPAFAAPGLPVNPVERKTPRYTSPDGAFHESILLLDENTEVNLLNNMTAGDRFDSKVQFTFNTTDTINGSMFSFAFSVPVYALRELDKDGNRSRWYVRSSYGPNLYDLDDGTIGMGGGVLIKTGHITASLGDGIKIKIITKPNKWQYLVAPSNRDFDISGLGVDLLYNNDDFIRTIPYDELDFIIGKAVVNATWNPAPPNPPPTGTPYSFDNMFFGIIEVTVRYTEPSNGLIMTDTFYVLVSGMGYNLGNFGKVVHIYNGTTSADPTIQSWYTTNNTGIAPAITGTTPQEKLERLFTNPPYGISVLVVLHESFDINDMNLNPTFPTANPAPTLFFFVAGSRRTATNTVVDDNTTVINGTTDIVMGRASKSTTGAAPFVVQGNSVIQNITNPAGMNGLIAYYFGEWPFSGTVPGVPATTYPFRVTTRGTYANINTTSLNNYDMNVNPSATGTTGTPYQNKMITDGFLWWDTPKGDGGIYNVKVGPGAMVVPYLEVDGYGSDKIMTYPYLH
jgi:hypothetical protein